MLGNWGGLRNELEEHGYALSITYRNDAASNIRGGFDKSKALMFADQYTFTLSADLQKIAGIADANFLTVISDRNGKDLSAERLIDKRQGQLGSSQEVFGRGSVVRLTRFVFQQRLFEGKLEYSVGRFGPDAFGQFTCDFQNLDFCGSSPGNWHGDDWYNFPISQWGSSAKLNFAPEWAFQIGVFEQNPTLMENRNHLKLSTSGGDGVIVPIELLWFPKQALLGYPAEYRVGAFFNTSDANDLYYGEDGQPQPLTPNGEFKNHSHRTGWWYVARQTVGLINNNPKRNVEMFSQGFWNDRATGYIARHFTLGVTINGPFDERQADAIGIAVGGLSVADDVSKRQRLINQLSGVFDYNDPRYFPVQGDEYSAEIYYGAKLNGWLTLRPNLQYIVHPGGVNQVDSALVGGLMVRASF
ncbi:carbohydrate porin [Pseudomonas putida]|uniref:carbohydrate porin n=1 Tax=Pseudomonas putida TaxID=303 RepID=UPI0023645B88|nr:carbohydrate porin [Pseudomonas putida]MDD1963810.1 carbohydrate porin [Pseudomonas putida]